MWVFPARAGMILMSRIPGENRSSIPRESGDDPDTIRVGTGASGYSPRERG